MSHFLSLFVGLVVGLLLAATVLPPQRVTVTYSEDSKACYFAQGYKAAARFVVNEKGEHLLDYVPSSGDLRACAKIGEEL